MSGLIRTVQRDGIEQAVELEREAAALEELARQKRHTAAILRSMTAVAAAWNPHVRNDTGLIVSSKPQRGESILTQPTGPPTVADTPPRGLTVASGENAIDPPSLKRSRNRQWFGYRGPRPGHLAAASRNGSGPERESGSDSQPNREESD